MATDISKEIDQLKNAVYGEEVRGAFISCMEKIHEENESYDNIKAQVAQSAENVEKQVGAIDTKAEEVQTSLDNLADAISIGKKQQTAIEQSVEKGKTQQTNLEETIKNAKTQQSAMIEELEENSNTQVNNFNAHVAEKTQESEQAITDARQQAVQTVTKQEELSVQAVKDETAEYIEEQKNTAKEEINSRADEKIEEINQAYKPLDEKVESLNEDVNTLKNDTKELNDKKITKFYASNQGETHLKDSDSGKIMDFKLYGRGEQNSTNGYQLLDYSLFKSANGATFEIKDNVIEVTGKGVYSRIIATLDINKYAGKTLYLYYKRFNSSVQIDNYKFNVQLNYNNGADTIYVASGTPTAIPDDIKTLSVELVVNNGKEELSEACKIQIEGLMLVEGTQKKEYEAYTGGIPSPNLSYPQQIKNVANPIVKICGKNLLKATLETQEKYGISCKNNNDGTYTFNGTLTSRENFDFYFIGDYYTDKPINNNTKFFGTIGLKDEIDGIYTFAIHKAKVIASGHTSFAGEGLVSAFMVRITKNIVLDNLVLKPMLVSSESEEGEFEEYKEQVATFPYTLNAIPVTSDGNYTDENGQQYIADFVDIERKKLVRVVKKAFLQQVSWGKISYKGVFRFYNTTSAALNIKQNIISKDNISMSSHFNFTNTMPDTVGQYTTNATGMFSNIGFAFTTDAKMTSDDFNEWISKNNPFVLFKLSEREEIDLTDEELEAFKKLETYYPVTNILITSDELDGYTTFNYPVSLENGWNYVKQQLGDNRDYIYNIDNRAQEIDMQSAEAYVNSEYAVALTELEVM